MLSIDDEFFVPQNVHTSYRLLGMGPRHLLRAGLGAPIFIALTVYLAFHVRLYWAILVVTVLAATYLAAWCYPTFGQETALDMVRHIRAKSRRQQFFPYALKEVESHEGLDPAGASAQGHEGPAEGR